MSDWSDFLRQEAGTAVADDPSNEPQSWQDFLSGESSESLPTPTVEPSPVEPSATPQPTIQFGDKQVPVERVREVAASRGVQPETITRLGTWQGRLESRLAKTPAGQTLLRAEQGLSDIGVTALSLANRAGIGNFDTKRLHREQRLREDFLSFVEKGSDIESVLGERGSRIYNSVVRSGSKIAAVGPAGKLAVYSTIGAESLD